MADSWPVAQVMAGASAVPMGHAIDLAFLFPSESHGWHDALTSETRRHIGGCLTAIETALRLALERAPGLASWTSRLPEQLCWHSVRSQPSLLSPTLLAHMRARAGVTLLLRQASQLQPGQAEQDESTLLPDVEDIQVGDAVSALALAEARWIAPGGENLPMRPDLPVEYMAELVWTAAACIAAAIGRMEDAENIGWSVFERAGQSLLSQHDEGAGPIAEADRLVSQMGEGSDAPELIGQALGAGRFLLFAALAGRRIRLPTMQVIEILISGTARQVAAVCRALGGSAADHRYLLISLAPARLLRGDADLVAQAQIYAHMSEAQSHGIISALHTPAPFRARLDHLMRVVP